jgi:phosphotransferase system  glucose/maltose/N-acetylglucosamine-specific IIC component
LHPFRPHQTRGTAIIDTCGRSLMRIIVAIAFIGILYSLASALFFLMRDKGKTNRTVNALTARIGLSVLLFLFVLFAHWMGWIQSTGLR